MRINVIKKNKNIIENLLGEELIQSLVCLYINHISLDLLSKYFKKPKNIIIDILKQESVFEYKVCTKCNKLLPFNDFHNRRGIPIEKCKKCVKIYAIENKNHIISKQKELHSSEKYKIKRKIWKIVNVEKIRKCAREKAHGVASFNTYAHRLTPIEECRIEKNTIDTLQVKCTYCGAWFTPELSNVIRRLGCINGNISGEQRFYCSINCKKVCPIYRQKLYPKDMTKRSMSREVQPELRKLVFERDRYICQKCEKSQLELDVPLHCHHITGVEQNPIESADVDNCITLCKTCHSETHKLPKCSRYHLRCNMRI